MIAKPQRDLPKSAGGVLHASPRQGESPIVPALEECVAYAIAPPTNRVHHPPSYPMVSHIGLREYASPAPMRHHNPFPLPLRPLVSHIWTTQVCITRSNEIPKSLPLISLTSPEPTKH